MSDELNISKGSIFFAPTSFNIKEEWSLGESILQRSLLRDELGKLTTTWSIEFRVNERISKKDISDRTQSWLKELVSYGLMPEDAKGSTPSPSKLTEKALLEIFFH